MGGTKAQPAQIINMPAQPPAPSASESAESIYQARMKYDPLLARGEYELQQEFMPKQAALEAALYRQYYPEYARSQQGLQQELYPQQAQILEAGAGGALRNLLSPTQGQLAGTAEQTALDRLQQPISQLQQLSETQALRNVQVSPLQQAMQQQALAGLTPTGYTPEQQQAINAIRQRESQRLSQSLRERSNLGGTLYGGRSQQLESRGLQELGQRYSAEDIDRLLAQRQVAMQAGLSVSGLGLEQGQQGLAGLMGVSGAQEASRQQALQNAMAIQQQYQQAAIPYMQILYPQIGTQQPSMQPFQYQSAVPSPDQLYDAMFEAGRRDYAVQPAMAGTPSPLWGLAGQIGGGLAGGIGAGWAGNFFGK